MKNRVVIIVASSSMDGNTTKLVDTLIKISDFDRIDLNNFTISYYDYSHKNANDDFINLMKLLINNYDTFLFATPVYWYSMSGILKVFFDRITDLLDNEKELGRKLRNKKMAVITSSVGDNLGNNFWLPFVETSNYLGMKYIANLHTIAGQIDDSELQKFVETINSQ